MPTVPTRLAAQARRRERVEPDQADYVPVDDHQTFRLPTWHECYSLDWGVGGDPAMARDDRERVRALLQDLSTPVDG